MDLFEGAPDKKVNIADLTKDGKYVIFGVPGAFTPGCSKTHLPGLLKNNPILEKLVCKNKLTFQAMSKGLKNSKPLESRRSSACRSMILL